MLKRAGGALARWHYRGKWACLLCYFLLVVLPAGAADRQAQLRHENGSSRPLLSIDDLSFGGNLTKDAARTEPTARYYYDAQQDTRLVQEAAEQNKDGVITNVTGLLAGQAGQYNEVYYGLDRFWSDDIVSNLFANIGQLLGKWLAEFLSGWVADTVQFLSAFLRTFVLNPNIPVNGINEQAGLAGTTDDIAAYIRQAADVMYGIAVDLLLLFFVLSIWRFWAEAAWKGGGNLMGAIGRLIFTAALLLAWPTIYAFEIQITNEMIKAIFFNTADQLAQLDAALAASVKAGLVAGAGGLAQAFAPVIGTAAGKLSGSQPGSLVLGTVGDIVSFAGLVIFTILGVVLIAEMIYFIVLKAIQTALLTAQYMFAPVFLVCFASPDSQSYASGYVQAWVETSLWTFIWIGLFKILVVVLYSNFNPWGKILMLVGILQLMIQVPAFLSRALISPMSNFVSAGLVSGLAVKGLRTLAKSGATVFDCLSGQAGDLPGTYQAKAGTSHELTMETATPELFSSSHGRAQVLAGPGMTKEQELCSRPPAKSPKREAQAMRNCSLPGIKQGIVDPTLSPVLDGGKSSGDWTLASAQAPARFSGQWKVMNGAQENNHALRKFAREKMSMLNSSSEADIGFSADGRNRLVGDGNGRLRHMLVRRGAADEEVVHLLMAGAFTELLQDDADAFDAASRAAFAARAAEPENTLAAGILKQPVGHGIGSHETSKFSSRELQGQLPAKLIFTQAVFGSQAYLSGQAGNLYTQYLKDRFGTWTDADDAWAHALMTDSSNAGCSDPDISKTVQDTGEIRAAHLVHNPAELTQAASRFAPSGSSKATAHRLRRQQSPSQSILARGADRAGTGSAHNADDLKESAAVELPARALKTAAAALKDNAGRASRLAYAGALFLNSLAPPAYFPHSSGLNRPVRWALPHACGISPDSRKGAADLHFRQPNWDSKEIFHARHPGFYNSSNDGGLPGV